nr:RNA-directed DNA polymerase, eukaryota, reverse transcriptase zinc-binding domain protein [Tanacetum cinerariifolium]
MGIVLTEIELILEHTQQGISYDVLGDPLAPYLFILVMESLHLSIYNLVDNGVTIGDRMTRIKAWENAIAKLRSRLSKWKVKTLSIGGRLTLLKSVLGASPIYSMSIFKVPCGVLKIMEAIRSSLKIDAHKTHTSSNWSAIVRELHSLKDKGFDFWSHCKKRIGNGLDTSFWYDCWIDDSALHIKFPRLFALKLDKDISVALPDSVILNNSKDRWYCDLSRDGKFWVKELRNFIDDKYLPSHTEATREWSEENLKVILNAFKCFFLASGVTIGDRMTIIKAWENVIVKLRLRLSKWKVKTLSIEGRLTLLKSVLGASPIYSMSIFKVPCGVLKIMETIRSRFFNGIGQDDSKITWIAWNKVLASKKRGGLGVSSFFALNRALLLKWVWRFISQDGSLWSCIIRSIYGPKIDAHKTHTSSNWYAIVRELHSLKDKGFDFWSHCKKRIGNGLDTSFWYDCWIDDSALHIEFPRLFALELDKDISVAGKMNSQMILTKDGNPVKNILLKLNLFDHRKLKGGGEGIRRALVMQEILSMIFFLKLNLSDHREHKREVEIPDSS